MTEVAVAHILRQIVARRRERVAAAGALGLPTATGVAVEPLTEADNPFLAALAGRRGRAVIAEVKMGSPSLGPLTGRVDPLAQARRYAEHGAAALSVVVEPDFFHGSYELLAACREASGLPAIAKEFVVDLVQLDWAQQAGADAVLLIAALYDRESLAAWADAARRRGLAPLIEIHHRAELDRLGEGHWELVGVNNRDLETFEVDVQHGCELAPSLPAAALTVAESGIRDADDLAALAAAGYDAFLVGESLLTADDPGRALEELVG